MIPIVLMDGFYYLITFLTSAGMTVNDLITISQERQAFSLETTLNRLNELTSHKGILNHGWIHEQSLRTLKLTTNLTLCTCGLLLMKMPALHDSFVQHAECKHLHYCRIFFFKNKFQIQLSNGSDLSVPVVKFITCWIYSWSWVKKQNTLS